MDNSALVKYYDPRTGKYEFATVLDVGDLSKLNTTIKTDLVSAINSLEGSGWGGGGEVPPELIDELENIKDAIASIKDGTFIIEEWGSFDQYFQSGIADAIEQLNIFNREQIVITVEEIESAIQESKDYYDQHLAETMQDVESARTDMANAQQTLNQTAQRLEEADLNYSEVTLKVDEIDQYIEGNIKSVKFDIVNAVTTEYESLVRQMEDEFGVNVEESFLSYLTGRVGKAEADISVQSGKIESKVGYDEFQYMPVEDIDQYNKNLLFHTMDFSEDWERNDVRAYITTDSFRHTRIIAMDISNAYYSSITDTLELGKTYTLSASFNIQPITKAPNEDRFAPTDGNYDVSAFIDGTEYPMVNLVENLTGVNGFKRLSVSFVSENENPEVYFRIKNLNAETSTGYMTAPKLEAGNESTPWQPHFDDEYATMLSTNSLVRQQGNEIVSLISSTKELGDKFVTATSSFQQLEDGFIRNAELIEEYEDAVIRYGMEVEELNDRITQKVWMDDFSDAVETISIDGKNRVLNSDFVDMSTDNNQLVLGSWENVDPLFTIEKIDGVNYAVIKRTGLTGNLVASMASNRFAVKNGERLMFGFDIIVETMPDVGNVFQIELLDINDIRVGLESFTLDQMGGDITLGEVSRLNYQYIINREDVAKARVRLMLTRNGHVKFTRVMAQQGTIKDTEWSPAPEDAQILRMKMQTEINQTAEQIQLLANDERLDAINDILYRKEGKLEVSPSEILARVTSSELGDDAVVTGTQLKLTEDALRFDLVGKDGLIQSINASEESLKIDFDRVEVNGLLLAQIISTQYLDVSEGFKIMHGSNMILGIHPQTGELTLNVPKLTINAQDVATKKDIEDIELMPGPKGEDGIAGKDGVGIRTTALAYASSTSGTTTPTSGWQTTVPTVAAGNYLWTRTTWTYTDNSVESGYTVSRIGKDGNTGNDGVAGKDGVGIKSTVIHYGGSTSGTSHSGVVWTTAIPSVPNGQFLWTRTTWTYDDNTTETGYSVAKMGETGATGPQGVSITKVDVQYYLSTSNTSLTGGSWFTTAPAWVDGRFMWSKTVTTYTSGSPTESKPVCITGAKGSTGSTGSTGAAGKGVSSITEEYYLSDSKTSRVGGSWVTTAPTWSTGKYMWTRSKIVWNNPTDTTYTTPIVDNSWEAVNELEIGGTQLLDGTKSHYKTLNLGVWYTDISGGSAADLSSYYNLKTGDTITYRVYISSTSGNGGAARLTMFDSSGSYVTYVGNVIQQGAEGYSTVTYTIASDRTRMSVGIQNTVGNGVSSSTVNYKEPKLEKGVKATSWSMSPNDYQKIVDDVEVGGVNMIVNSNQFDYSTTSSTVHTNIITNVTEPLVIGNEYTFSFDIKATANGKSDRIFINSSMIIYKDFNFTSEWTRHFVTFVYDGGTYSGRQIHPHLYPDMTGTKYIRNVKLETGNKATGWSPAPEDLYQYVDDMEIGGENILFNSDFSKSETGTSFTVGGKTYNTYPTRWGGYNGGAVSNPQSNYHAHLNNTTFDYNVMEFNESNGTRHWKGARIYITGLVKKYGTYVLSVDLYPTGAGTKFFGGFYYFKKGGTEQAFHGGQFTILPNVLNKWVRYSTLHTLPEDADLSKNINVYIYGYDFQANSILYVKNIQLQEGNKPTEWRLSNEDIQANIDEKADGTATNEYLQGLASAIQTTQQEAEARASQEALDEFLSAYNAFVKSQGEDKLESERRLSDAITTLAAVESNLGDMAARWNFLDTTIQMSEQGLMIGNQSKGTYILQTDDRISFFSNGTETAYISGNMLHIEQAVFVRSIQIGDFMITEEGAGAISFRSVL